MFSKKRQRVLHGHVQHLGDVLAAVGHLQRLTVVALAVAHLAGHVDVGQEVHLDLDLAVALAGLAAAAAHVEGEAPRRVAAGLGLGRGGEQRADVVPQADVGGRVRARRAPDGALVDVDRPCRACSRPGDLARRRPVRRWRVVQRGWPAPAASVSVTSELLPDAGHARDHGERAEGNLQRDVVQVVLARRRVSFSEPAARLAAQSRAPRCGAGPTGSRP